MGRLLFLTAVAAAFVVPLRLWVVEPIYIASASMEPTLPVNRHLFLDKVTLRFRSPRRGDIVAFKPPAGELDESIKRVIALPGDTVELREKKVFVNGISLEENYVKYSRADEKLQGDSLGPLEVPRGKVFVLGDNRDESEDSSVWKNKEGEPAPFVDAADIRGLVRGIY